MKQRTILREGKIAGVTLHSGHQSSVKLCPAEVNAGIRFYRTDLIGRPEIIPNVASLDELVRSTSIKNGYAKIGTIEHLMAACYALGVSNLVVEVDTDELPILDGSAKYWTNLLLQSEIVEQEAERPCYVLKEPVTITKGNRSLIALPYDGFKISATLVDDKGRYTQHLSLEVNQTTFLGELAPARTFVDYDDLSSLMQLGKIGGGSIDSAIVIKGDQIISREALRYQDEFVRHKILDLIGDLSLLGSELKMHIIAVRPGHALNAELAKAIQEKKNHPVLQETETSRASMKTVAPVELDIRRILNLLPHRYPFIMVDRVLQLGSEDEVLAIKNVTINEPYFCGHFPGQPIMPGVLQLEAMAQTAGILMLTKANIMGKLAFFMSCDKVKFRAAVTPGDQLEIHAKLVKQRAGKLAVAQCECRVNDKVVSSAELTLMLVENKE